MHRLSLAFLPFPFVVSFTLYQVFGGAGTASQGRFSSDFGNSDILGTFGPGLLNLLECEVDATDDASVVEVVEVKVELRSDNDISCPEPAEQDLCNVLENAVLGPYLPLEVVCRPWPGCGKWYGKTDCEE
jgi:hypothetical protein